MRFIKDLAYEQQKPFLTEAARIDSLLAYEVYLQAFLDIALSRTNHFTNAAEPVDIPLGKKGFFQGAGNAMRCPKD